MSKKIITSFSSHTTISADYFTQKIVYPEALQKQT